MIESPSQEAIDGAIQMFKYFWVEKGDVTTWARWDEWSSWFNKNRPDIYDAYVEYARAKKKLDLVCKNI